ncbi:MAG: thiamine ABC transporter substrate-binding protein [Thermoproteota archaeon]|nr:thiamine ABC transporter substrate-binding protein [Candidatus Brockarchaeota archaeon]MBO3768207.1 thiamine ABC transporter substrate-binding protein [Candidatus Brockarchaeota archaeon]MBO3801258.1 thiamine ABC transporter substrate-binding protein [Candidatus Brockarchaeota archaeon]
MRLSKKQLLSLVVLFLLLFASILYLNFSQPKLENSLVVYGPEGDEYFAKALISAFQKRFGVNVTYVHYGMGAIDICNKLISEKNAPQADVILGIPDFYSKVVIDSGVLETFTPNNLSLIPRSEIFDSSGYVFPLDKGYILITYNLTIIKKKNLPVPSNLDDLLNPAYKGLVFYQDPTTSGTGLAFLVWVLSVKGETEGFSFLKKLEGNIKFHPSGWSSSINALKIGEVAIGSMFSTDVGYSEVPNLTTTAEVGFVYREGIALVKGAKHPNAAKKFIEFALSNEGQNLTAPYNYMYPVNPKASYSDIAYAPIPKEVITFNTSLSGNVTQWLELWRREVKSQ